MPSGQGTQDVAATGGEPSTLTSDPAGTASAPSVLTASMNSVPLGPVSYTHLDVYKRQA